MDCLGQSTPNRRGVPDTAEIVGFLSPPLSRMGKMLVSTITETFEKAVEKALRQGGI